MKKIEAAMITAQQAHEIAVATRIKEEDDKVGKYLENILIYISESAAEGQFSVTSTSSGFPDLNFWHSDRRHDMLIVLRRLSDIGYEWNLYPKNYRAEDSLTSLEIEISWKKPKPIKKDEKN